MIDVYEEYRKKLVTPQEAVKLVKDGDWVDYSQTCSFPEALDEALAARRDELHDVKIRNAIAMKPIQVVEQDPEQKAFTYNAWHCSGLDRKYVDQGRAYYMPMLFRDNAAYYKRGYAPVNVAMVSVAPMDKHGYFSFGLTNCAQEAMLEAADHIILEVNEEMPVIYGMEADHIHISEVDYVVEGHRHIGVAPGGSASDLDRQIAQQIFDERLTVRETEKLLKKLQKEKENPEKKVEADQLALIYEHVQELMKQILGTKVTVHPKKNHTGKIEIEYYSQEELDHLLEMMQTIQK